MGNGASAAPNDVFLGPIQDLWFQILGTHIYACTVEHEFLEFLPATSVWRLHTMGQRELTSAQLKDIFITPLTLAFTANGVPCVATPALLWAIGAKLASTAEWAPGDTADTRRIISDLMRGEKVWMEVLGGVEGFGEGCGGGGGGRKGGIARPTNNNHKQTHTPTQVHARNLKPFVKMYEVRVAGSSGAPYVFHVFTVRGKNLGVSVSELWSNSIRRPHFFAVFGCSAAFGGLRVRANAR
jgi:hypothetical protein